LTNIDGSCRDKKLSGNLGLMALRNPKAETPLRLK
jgi:hypothetical protein